MRYLQLYIVSVYHTKLEKVVNFSVLERKPMQTDMGNDMGSWSSVFVAILMIVCRNCSALPLGGCTPPPNILVNGYEKLSQLYPYVKYPWPSFHLSRVIIVVNIYMYSSDH